MTYPKYVEIDGKKYKINTSYLIGIQCDKIAKDKSIGDFERALSIIYTLFGEEGIDAPEHYEKLLEMAKKYLSCGKEIFDVKEEEIDYDYEQDYSYIKASFLSDYGIRLDDDMHWWEFQDLMNGLSNSEFGSCCIFNRIRNLRNFDLSKIKDDKERQKIKEAQDRVALKKELTQKQKESINQLFKDLGIEKEV